MSALDNPRPLRVTCAATLATLYAGVLLFVSATICYQLLSGTGNIGSADNNRFALRGMLGVVLLTAAGAGYLLFSTAQAAAGRDYRWILWPLRVFLLIGAVGQSADLIGGGLIPANMPGFGILAAAALPVLLLSTSRAKAYLTATAHISGAPGHHLLPHERWFASLILERQRAHRNSATPRNPATLRMEQNYGPEGIALIAAGLITVLPAMLLVLLGFVCLIASGGHPWLLTLLYWLYGIGFALMLWGSIRSVQASNAGRAFRGGRPFVKRP